jgi:hypothetical protein
MGLFCRLRAVAKACEDKGGELFLCIYTSETIMYANFYNYIEDRVLDTNSYLDLYYFLLKVIILSQRSCHSCDRMERLQTIKKVVCRTVE